MNPTIDDLADTSFACVATELKVDQPKNFNSPQVVVRLKIVEGPFTGYDGLFYKGGLGDEPVGAKGTFIPLDSTLEALRAMGWQGDDLTTVMDDGLGSCKCYAVTKMRSYVGRDGKARRTVEVKFINKYGARGGKMFIQNEVQLNDLKNLAKRIAGKAKLTPKVTVSESNAAPPPAALKAAEEAAEEAPKLAAVPKDPAKISF